MRMIMSAAVVSKRSTEKKGQEKRAVVLATGIQQLLVQFNATLAINFPM